MNLHKENIQEYCNQNTSPQSELLAELERKTHLSTLAPQMLTGHFQGRFLAMLSKMLRPHRILEIGTFTGYGALCLAEGLGPNAELHTVEVNEEITELAQSFFDRSEYGDRIHLHLGNALTLIPKWDIHWNLVFLDAAKTDYKAYYELLLPNMSTGDIILADNVLWSGKVLNDSTDADTLALQSFNIHVTGDKRVENVLLPVRDGLMMIRKL